jgi:hypothetical protein
MGGTLRLRELPLGYGRVRHQHFVHLSVHRIGPPLGVQAYPGHGSAPGQASGYHRQPLPLLPRSGILRSYGGTRLYSSTGEEEAASECRQAWHRRWCGPSDQNSRSQRKQPRRVRFLIRRLGLA